MRSAAVTLLHIWPAQWHRPCLSTRLVVVLIRLNDLLFLPDCIGDFSHEEGNQLPFRHLLQVRHVERQDMEPTLLQHIDTETRSPIHLGRLSQEVLVRHYHNRKSVPKWKMGQWGRFGRLEAVLQFTFTRKFDVFQEIQFQYFFSNGDWIVPLPHHNYVIMIVTTFRPYATTYEVLSA